MADDSKQQTCAAGLDRPRAEARRRHVGPWAVPVEGPRGTGLALVVVLLALLLPPAALAAPPGGGWTRVLGDDFNGTPLNTSRWEAKDGGRSGQMQYANPKNGEAQW